MTKKNRATATTARRENKAPTEAHTVSQAATEVHSIDFDVIKNDAENRAYVLDLMEAHLTHDPVWTDKVVADITKGDVDLRLVLAWLAKTRQPKTYLEVGVRRGWSMAAVAGRCPDVHIVGVDGGKADGVDNLGLGFVREEIGKLGHKGPLHLLHGNSHQELPILFGRHPNDRFDLILVDGDHSILGAWQDLVDTLPRLQRGGVLVFDDIAPDPTIDLSAERGEDPHGWGSLMGVWRHAESVWGDLYDFHAFTGNAPGVGVAVRK